MCKCSGAILFTNCLASEKLSILIISPFELIDSLIMEHHSSESISVDMISFTLAIMSSLSEIKTADASESCSD